MLQEPGLFGFARDLQEGLEEMQGELGGVRVLPLPGA